MSYQLYLIAGPAALRDQANQAATAWDAKGGQFSFLPPMLYALGADPTVATHTAVHLRVDDDVAPAIAAAIAADFPGWQMIQNDDVDAALAQAGLARATQSMPAT
jgi:hypothetical protein